MMAKANTLQNGVRWAAAVLLFFTMLIAVPPSMAEDTGVAQVKAAFLYNFAKFAEWPADTFSAQDAPVIIGVVDDASFARVLEETVKGKQINGRNVRIKQIASDADLKGRIHVLYFPSASDKRIASMLTALGGTSVLTVGESDRFSRGGGMIRLFVQDARMRFEINPDSAERARIKLSARLLALARIVRGTSAER